MVYPNLFLRFIVLSWLILLFFPATGLTQESPPQSANEARPQDDRIRISGGEKFDFVFNRGILVPNESVPADSAPLNTSSSGSYSVGIGFAIPLGKTVAIRIEPRINWHMLNFRQNNAKTFPTDSGNVYVFERIRGVYGEFPIGLRFNLARNAEDKVRLFVEGGFSAGYLLGSVYKNRTGSQSIKVTTKYHGVWGLNKLRYGPYFRLGTNWIAVFGYYRIPEVFSEKKSFYDVATDSAQPFPKFPKLEVGFSLMF